MAVFTHLIRSFPKVSPIPSYSTRRYMVWVAEKLIRPAMQDHFLAWYPWRYRCNSSRKIWTTLFRLLFGVPTSDKASDLKRLPSVVQIASNPVDLDPQVLREKYGSMLYISILSSLGMFWNAIKLVKPGQSMRFLLWNVAHFQTNIVFCGLGPLWTTAFTLSPRLQSDAFRCRPR